MARYQIMLAQIRNNNQATKTIIKSGSALKRVGQAAGRIADGREEFPENGSQLRDVVLNNVFGQEPDKYAFLSRFGTPVRNYLKVIEGSYQLLDGDGKVATRRYAPLFLETAIISVNQPKNIVQTDINGRNGSRKEFISNGDYEIQITGELVGPHPLRYPQREVDLLRDICNSPEPLTVICPHLQTFGINTIIIKGTDFAQEEGFYNVQKYAISAISHQPIDIYLEESQKDQAANKSRLSAVIKDAQNKVNELQKRINDALIQSVDRSDTTT